MLTVPRLSRSLRSAFRVSHCHRSLASAAVATASKPSFPCVDAHAERNARLHEVVQERTNGSPSASGPEPPYARPLKSSYSIFHHPKPFQLTYAPPLPSLDIAYETWGKLNADKSNVVLLHTGLSASSHAASTQANTADGWWEKFIGPSTLR